MTKPKLLTKELWEERRQRQRENKSAAFRRAVEPVNSEIEQDVGLATELIAILDLPRVRRRARRDEITAALANVISVLAAVLVEVRREWQTRQEILPDLPLPILGEIRLTPGEMHVTLEEGLKHAKRLRDWYQSLPEELLFVAGVQFTEGPVALWTVIERLAETLEAFTAIHEPQPGRQAGRRAAAQSAARYLIHFIDRYAPDAPTEKQQVFMYRAICRRGLGIDCPSLEDDPGDFAIWFREAEALARSSMSDARI